MEQHKKQLQNQFEDEAACIVPHYRILLADDDLEMRKMLAWSLKRQGYQVVECFDGNTLMKKLGFTSSCDLYRSFDLIISDIRMPGATGMKVLESAREYEDFPPIILITAFPEKEAGKQARQLGAATMLAKPFDVDELIGKVRRILLFKPVGEFLHHGSSEKAPAPLPFPLEITFRHDDQTEPVKEYVRDMAARLSRFSQHIDHVRVVMEKLSPREHKKHRYNITINVKIPSRAIDVKHCTDKEDTGENLYLGIHIAFGTACRRLKQYIKKNNKKRSHIAKVYREEDEEESM